MEEPSISQILAQFVDKQQDSLRKHQYDNLRLCLLDVLNVQPLDVREPGFPFYENNTLSSLCDQKICDIFGYKMLQFLFERAMRILRSKTLEENAIFLNTFIVDLWNDIKHQQFEPITNNMISPPPPPSKRFRSWNENESNDNSGRMDNKLPISNSSDKKLVTSDSLEKKLVISNSSEKKLATSNSSTSDTPQSSIISSTRLISSGGLAAIPYQDGVKLYVSRDAAAKLEEEHGNLTFLLVSNSESLPTEQCELLVALKNLFAAQLPKMPKDYIVRLIFDYKHTCLAAFMINPETQKRELVGAIAFRSFHSQGFAEIVFAAVRSSWQVKGIGSRLMNHLKEHVKQQQIFYFLTYADEQAIGYFERQGFTLKISLPHERYIKYIKEYDGGRLMECRICKDIDYTNIPGIIAEQKKCVFDKICTISKSHVVYDGLSCFKEIGGGIDIMQIPGIKETGYQRPIPRSQTRTIHYDPKAPLTRLQAKLGLILKKLSNHPDAWPFLEPVDKKYVPDYYDVVTEPMDFKTMEDKLNGYQYRTKEQFIADMQLLLKNCRTYNAPDTIYVKCTAGVEKAFDSLVKRLNNS